MNDLFYYDNNNLKEVVVVTEEFINKIKSGELDYPWYYGNDHLPEVGDEVVCALAKNPENEQFVNYYWQHVDDAMYAAAEIELTRTNRFFGYPHPTLVDYYISVLEGKMKYGGDIEDEETIEIENKIKELMDRYGLDIKDGLMDTTLKDIIEELKMRYDY